MRLMLDDFCTGINGCISHSNGYINGPLVINTDLRNHDGRMFVTNKATCNFKVSQITLLKLFG